MADYDINERYSMWDRSRAISPDGKVMPVVNTLNLKVDDFYRDVPFKMCNRGLVHVFRRGNEMAASSTRRSGAGVKPTKLGSHIVTEHIVKKERLRSIDEVNLDGLDEAAIRQELANQDEAHVRQLGEDGVDAFFNGGVTEDGASIRGLKERLSALNPTTLNNVLSCGHASASNNSRIFIVEWNMQGDVGCFGLIPAAWMGKGPLGVKSVNFGPVKTIDPNDSEASMITHDARHYLYTGIAVGDNLKIACLANINTDEDGANNFISGNGSRKLFKLLENGHFDINKTRIYCNPDIATQIRILGNEKSNLTLSSGEVFGRRVTMFDLIPIRVLDKAILSSSEAVVA